MQLSYSNNIFCEIAGKIHLLLTPRKTDGRVPGQQGTPATCNLTYWEVCQQTYVQTLLASFGLVIGQKFRCWGGGGQFSDWFIGLKIK